MPMDRHLLVIDIVLRAPFLAPSQFLALRVADTARRSAQTARETLSIALPLPKKSSTPPESDFTDFAGCMELGGHGKLGGCQQLILVARIHTPKKSDYSQSAEFPCLLLHRRTRTVRAS